MNFKENIFIGTDIEKISRFEDKTLERDSDFLKKIFTENELKYCYSNKNPTPHLTARFCAKEATVKALTCANIKGIYYKDIEITHNENKCPIIKIKGVDNVSVKLSISHSIDYATATVILCVDK